MAGVTILSSTTINLASLPNSITANGNGTYSYGYGAEAYINMTVGFVYSIGAINVANNTLIISGINTGQIRSGLETISEIATPNVYPGGASDFSSNYTATNLNVNQH